MHIVDTSGWLEYLADSPQAGHFTAAVEDTEHLLVPAIVVCEVFKKVTQAFDENRVLQAIAQLDQGRVVNVDETIAIHAGKLSLEKRLPMADALIHSTAVLHGATVYTKDAHFERGWRRCGTFADRAR
ncbi:MAG: type II toxin-antitoxin system VapC family toxin [Rubrivivax sp.]|nr:type II toxin-antitoxin system VapC family toxin [Rubrivivax sp.]